MHFYNSAAQQVLGVLMATVLTLAVTWLGRHLTNREKALEEAISIHDTIIKYGNDLARIDDWMRGVETVGRDMIAKFEAGKKINEYDMAALKRELDQKPDLK